MSLSEFRCTNCGSNKFATVDRKYVVTSLRRCEACHLLYRIPTDDLDANFKFYQRAYRQGFTTQLPNDETLEKLLTTRFEGTEMCYHNYISVLRQLGLPDTARVFDYGCSWGYGSWQLIEAGYQVVAYEISKSRAKFAKDKLGIECIPEITVGAFQGKLLGSFDCFFSAHVLEHVPSPARVVELAKLALRPGGYFVAFTPNGCEVFRQADPRAWHLFWGKAHPNLLDDAFYRYIFSAYNLYLDSSPIDLDALARFAGGGKVVTPNLSQSELLCVAKL
jgi:2-polyprenyl-3-methyl-5-hydroxy-6-metoxy-1,4-benzoquinol methylase